MTYFLTALVAGVLGWIAGQGIAYGDKDFDFPPPESPPKEGGDLPDISTTVEPSDWRPDWTDYRRGFDWLEIRTSDDR